MHLFMVSKLEAGQVKLQSRLEEEEEAKAALMGRIPCHQAFLKGLDIDGGTLLGKMR